MCRSVTPLKVSPFIKTLRWTFLFMGIFYGVNKQTYLRAYEEKVGPKRHAEIQERHRRLKEEGRKNSIGELFEVGKAFEVQEFPPGWERDI